MRPPSEGDSLPVEYQGFLKWTQTLRVKVVVTPFDTRVPDKIHLFNYLGILFLYLQICKCACDCVLYVLVYSYKGFPSNLMKQYR